MKLNFFKKKEVKNAGWLMSGKIAQMLISLVVGVLTARYLGPSNYGLIGYASAYTAFFMAFCTLGLNSIMVKEFVDDPDSEGTIIGTTLVMRAVSSLLSGLLIVLIVSFIDADEPTTIAVVALSCVGLLFHVFEVFRYWFQAHLQAKVTAIISFIAYAATAIYKVVLLILGKNVLFFAFATSVDYIVVAILLLIAYKKHGGKRLRFSWPSGKRMLRSSCHFIMSGLMVSIYGKTDTLMLKQLLDETSVGYYATATTICTMWCFVLTAIIDSLVPSIMEANNQNEELFKKRNRQLYAIVFYVSLAVSVLFMIFADLAIRILYGEAYLPAANPLRIITWYTAFSYLGVARNAWLVCKQRQKYLKYIYVLAIILNITLNSIFIPMWGASGAALASLATQIGTSIVLPFLIPGLRDNAKLMLEAICLKGVK